MSFSLIYSIVVFVVAIVLLPIMFKKMNDTGEGTPRKKKNKAKNMSPETVNEQTSNNKRSSKRGASVLDIWGIEQIEDGLIKLTGNRWAKIYRIVPVNFELLSNDEQSVVEMALVSTIMSQDFPVQFVSTAERVDTRYALQYLSMATQGETSAKRKMYAQALQSFLNELMIRRSILVRRSYLVLSCENNNQEKARGLLEHRATLISSALARARILLQPLTTAETVDLLAHFLNRNSLLKPSEALRHGALDFAVVGKGVIGNGITKQEKEEYITTTR